MANATATRAVKSRQSTLKNVAAPKGEGHKVSSTNMVEARPRDRKASAGNKGSIGMALAQVFIHSFEAIGRAIEGNRSSRKDKLREVVALGNDDLTAFHKAMLDRSEEVRLAMETEKKGNPLIKGLREYFELHPGMETVYVETSMWKKIAMAVDAGWKPEVDDAGAYPQTWVNITMAATAALDGKGKPSTDPANPNRAGSSKKKQGRAATTPQSKAVTAVAAALKDANGNKLAKNNRNLTAVIEGILDADGGATLEELTEIAAMLQRKLDAAKKANDEAVKALAIASASSKDKELADNQSRTSAGAVVTRTDAATGTPKRSHSRAKTADELIAKGKELTASPQSKGERRYSTGRTAKA